MKKIVIYPGRFQPMLPHHANVFQHLQSQFPGADVYIATSDKVEGTKSAFNFNEKATIMSKMHGIPAEKIIQAKVPYLIDSYKTQFDQENNMVIFAVGGKDADRFPMSNIDDSTGLDMTVRGEPRAKYYQMINTLEQHPPLPMSERGYVYNSPTFSNDGEVASASAFRNAFISAPDDGSRKEIFTKYMGSYNNNIYALFVNKLLDNKMKTENAYNLDVVKYLSGLLNEAPINFDDFSDDPAPQAALDSDDYKPGFKQDNMINQLGKIIDSDDAGKEVDAMKVKKFSPKTTVQTDDDDTVNITASEAKALKGMMDMLTSARMGEEQSARERFLKTIQTTVGLESMLDFAKSKGLVKEETKTLPQVDLSAITDDYEVDEGTFVPGFIGADGKATSKPTQADYDSNDEYQQMKKVAGIKGKDDEAEEETESFDPRGEPTAYDAAMEVYDIGDEPALAEHLGMSDEELDAEINEYGAMHALHADDDREEIIQGVVLEILSNADNKYEQSGDIASSQVEDLNDLRKRAGLEEAPGEYTYRIEGGDSILGNELYITSPEGEEKKVADDFTYFDEETDNQENLESWFVNGHGLGDEGSLVPATEEAGLEEGRMKDIIQDAIDMSKEEFDAKWKGSFDYDQLNKDYNDDLDEESVEEGKLPAGLQAYQDKKNGKKDDDDEEVDEDKEDKEEVDEDKEEDENAQFESSLAQLKRLSGI